MQVVHLMASPFVGGPERQVLGLARALPPECRTTLLSFAERGLARQLLDLARQQGFEAVELRENFPNVRRAAAEIAGHLKRLQADVLCTSGYKPDLIGWRAARRAGIPVVGIAHGWTGVTLKVRLYETLDALVMRWLDTVVCVSEAMAARVRRAGVPARKVIVVRNALDTTPFDNPFPDARRNVELLFSRPPRLLVGAVGRLSPEKGFDVLVDAAAVVVRSQDDVGFVLFGDGPLRQSLEARVRANGLEGRFVLAGFRNDLDKYLPGLDLAVSSSHTEGLPVAVLEAQAAGLPVVATAVGGTPEVIQEAQTGLLVAPGDPSALAGRILTALSDEPLRQKMGRQAWQRVRDEFTFAAQAARYQALFARLVPGGRHVAR
jgi:glycosyltransferase involved in cell wall biosynthesis